MLVGVRAAANRLAALVCVDTTGSAAWQPVAFSACAFLAGFGRGAHRNSACTTRLASPQPLEAVVMCLATYDRGHGLDITALVATHASAGVVRREVQPNSTARLKPQTRFTTCLNRPSPAAVPHLFMPAVQNHAAFLVVQRRRRQCHSAHSIGAHPAYSQQDRHRNSGTRTVEAGTVAVEERKLC